MQIRYHKEYSYNLGRDMEYKVYGHKGKPVLVFPTSNSRFFQYENEGMIDTLSQFINEGKIQVWTVDSIDWESFFSDSWDNNQRIARQEQYFKYINEEIVPKILEESKNNNFGHEQKILATGCSMGAYHAANFFFRFPWFIDGVIGLSGVYSTRHFFGDYKNTEIYLNSPVDYLKNLQDPFYYDKYRNSRLIFCCGLGAYENLMIEDTNHLKYVLEEKNIPAWVDFWGHDVSHDWPWWRTQIYHYISNWV